MEETDCIDVEHEILLDAFKLSMTKDLINQSEKIEKGINYIKSLGIVAPSDKWIEGLEDHNETIKAFLALNGRYDR